MDEFVIDGGVPLRGTVTPSGNKNAAFPLIAAALLTDEPVRLYNLPDIADVRTMLALVERLGVEVDRHDPHTVSLRARRITTTTPDPALLRRVRGGLVLMGPLLAREGEARVERSGGDQIGRRRIDTHVLGLQALGAVMHQDDGLVLRGRPLRGADILLDEASVTATENVVLAAALAEGTTILRNAACEPHVQETCALLAAMGARIEGLGSNLLRIHGVPRLHGAEFTLGPDFMEVGSFMALAVVTFPADLMSVALVTATQAEGAVLFHEKMYESRLFFVDKLIGMGARVVLCDPHRALVHGPGRLRGEPTGIPSPDIRAGIALVVAALCAEGRTVIRSVDQIDRGYENIDAKLEALGARIRRVRV